MPLNENVLNDLILSKGRVEGVPISAFDRVSPCRGDECPLRIKGMCSYKVKEKGDCTVERSFVRYILTIFIELVEKSQSAFHAQVIGFQLIPLYADLIKMMKRELALDDDAWCYISNDGKRNIHPIYDEKRKIMREINSTLKSTGMIAAMGKYGLLGTVQNMQTPEEILRKGASSYYEQMAGSEED